MPTETLFSRVLKANKQRWADASSVVSIILIIGLLSIASFFADAIDADESSRMHIFLLVLGAIIVACIWQAAAFVAATIETALQDRQDDARTPDT